MGPLPSDAILSPRAAWTLPAVVATALLLAAPALAATLQASSASPTGPAGIDETVQRVACTELTNGTVWILTGFAPDCVVVDNREKITWENIDEFAHDPGDGTQDAPVDACFSASKDLGGFLPPGDSYAIQLFFDETEEKLYREKAWYNGNDRTDHLSDPSSDEACPDRVWAWADEDRTTIVVDYICHRHPDQDGRILLEV